MCLSAFPCLQLLKPNLKNLRSLAAKGICPESFSHVKPCVCHDIGASTGEAELLCDIRPRKGTSVL